MIDRLFVFLFFIISSIEITAQDRSFTKTTIDYKVVSVLNIPRKSYWSNSGIISGNFNENWFNSDGSISCIFLAIPKDFPDYYILITPNIWGFVPEHVSSNIYSYDKISVHAYPSTLVCGYSWYLFPKNKLFHISENVEIFSSIVHRLDIYYCGHSNHGLEIKVKDFINSLKYWEYYFSSKNQHQLKNKSYKYGEVYHYKEYSLYYEYFSIVSYKDVIRFNCKQFDGGSISTAAYLESNYYEIPKSLWDQFIQNAKLNKNLGLISGNELIKF